ncbi:MAG: DUF3783 domain-containing protein [Solobacterium sp.]|nr:DUF3783 domain-containing protein [Solobacterium sp.]MDY2952303.1 DUF3783 domain-containing protein [Erysipelotrichaceae bacterium]MCI6695859.1 DUF3783 domain-containing protein [Solobacterium sp.]MCI6878188.1 DUF3783 domain-containing protein [Solobacterium sp.]MCI7156674.1 DUF3783 domain-containing protein [Solobacterium sp.]
MKIKLMNLDDNKQLIDLLTKLNIEIEFLPTYKELGMMVLCDFNEGDVDFILKTLRMTGIKVPLKAIETEINKNWSPSFMYDQLLEEYLYYLKKSSGTSRL